MGSGFFLKKPFSNHDDVIDKVKQVERLVKAEAWNEAEKECDEGILAWEKVKNRIQFSVERGFLEQIDYDLAELKGSIIAQDPKNVIITSEKIVILWNELGK